MVKLTAFPIPTEGIHFQLTNVAARVDDKELGSGTLFVTESDISWLSGATDNGFHIQYMKMTLHAVSRDHSVHPNDCIYIMINGDIGEKSGDECEMDDDEEEDDNDPEEKITEVRFTPNDSEVLQAIFTAIQDCTLLHPDPSSDMSDENDIGECEEDGEGNDEDDLDEDMFDRMRRHLGIGDGGTKNGNNEEFDPEEFADAD